jgi:beta-mannosidase
MCWFRLVVVLLSISSLVLTVASSTGSTAGSLLLLDAVTKFNLRSCDNSKGPFLAVVPGSVHLDLMRNDVINVDPYFRYEEKNLSWVAHECWEYESQPFSFPDTFDLSNDVNLRFQSLDGVADVLINGIVLGQAHNAHREHDFTVSRAVWIADGRNVLTIRFNSALQFAKQQASFYPYPVPETVNFNVWAEPTNRNFMRKAGSDFGWDWGPAFINTGISSHIVAYQQPLAKLDGIVVQQVFSNDVSRMELHVNAVFTKTRTTTQTTKVPVTVFFQDNQRIESTIDMHSCTDKSCMMFVGIIVVDNPELWWPVGYGNQTLHKVQVDVLHQSVTKHIGIRTVQLVQEAIKTDNDHSNDVSFYIKINGRAIFMRGANFIPIDSFHTRVTHADRAYILHTALESNMNMLRVWGGGIYQSDDFYEMADKLGIMIWQEVMLACALYPRNREFLSEVREEVRQQAVRLNTHPSIVVWGGNNENEVALQWFESSRNNRDLYVADYAELYANTVYPTLTAVLGTSSLQRTSIWVDSSPSNGLLSEDPYAKLWGSASTASQGDVHFYDYACDCEDFNSFPKAKFISEFGFQTMPSFQTYETVLLPEDYDSNANSPVLQYRQRHEDGNTQIDNQMRQHFQVPAECGANNKQRMFDMYLYLIGLQQSRCYETAMNRWRQLRGFDSTVAGDQHTMGVLYWQLNDIWQGPSWASTEYSGRWKPLQYSTRRVFEMVSLSISYVAQPNTLQGSPVAQVYLVNDFLDLAATVQVTVELKAWQSNISTVVWQNQVSMRSEQSLLVTTVAVDTKALMTVDCEPSSCYLKVTASQFDWITGNPNLDRGEVQKPLVATAPLSSMKSTVILDNPALEFSRFEQQSSHVIGFSVRVNATSPFLFLEITNDPNDDVVKVDGSSGVFQRYAGWFSDNNFLAEVGETYDLTYTSFIDNMDVSTLQKHLQGRVLQHAYQCELPLFMP